MVYLKIDSNRFVIIDSSFSFATITPPDPEQFFVQSIVVSESKSSKIEDNNRTSIPLPSLVVTMQYRYRKQWWCKRIEKEREEQSRFHLKDRRERSFCERHAEDKRNELSLSGYRNDEVERERRKMDGPASTNPLREEREREVWEEWEVRRTLADNNKVLIKQLVKRGGLVNSRSWMEMAQGMKEARASLLPGYVPSFVFILLVSLFFNFFPLFSFSPA